MRGQPRVGLVRARRKICLASSDSNAVQHSDIERGLEEHLLAGLLPATLRPAGSPVSTTSLSGFRIESPLRVMDSAVPHSASLYSVCTHLPAPPGRQCTCGRMSAASGLGEDNIELASSICEGL